MDGRTDDGGRRLRYVLPSYYKLIELIISFFIFSFAGVSMIIAFHHTKYQILPLFYQLVRSISSYLMLRSQHFSELLQRYDIGVIPSVISKITNSVVRILK